MTESTEGQPLLPSRSQFPAAETGSTHTINASNATSTLTRDALDGSPPVAAAPFAAEAFKDIAYGSIAGTVGKLIEYPFDTVKVRLQSQPVNRVPPLYNGPLDCFRKSTQTGGISGLYRGVSAPLVGAAVETSSLFFSYRVAQHAYQALSESFGGSEGTGNTESTAKTPLPFSGLVICGGASGAFTSLLLTPIEFVKCQMQIPASSAGSISAPRNPLSVIASVLKYHGPLGLWHGQLGTLIRETGGSASWFGSYEGVSLLFRERQAKNSLATELLDQSSQASSASPVSASETLPVWQQMVAGAIAGVLYNFVCFPADTIKSRMQTEEISSNTSKRPRQHSTESSKGTPLSNNKGTKGLIHHHPRMTFMGTARELWHSQGVKGFYSGCGITLVRAAPSSAVIFALYEWLRGGLG
ncbi:hypothetical protein MMC25_005040 [Agyrium rufum]|nr:hypothetical protein [Agyrium rufum]